MLHNNSILSVYFIMLHSLVDVRIASVFIWKLHYFKTHFHDKKRMIASSFL